MVSRVADAARSDMVCNAAAAHSLLLSIARICSSKRFFGKPLAASGASIGGALSLQFLDTCFAEQIFLIFLLLHTKLVLESDT
jgi:hypothetical protein